MATKTSLKRRSRDAPQVQLPRALQINLCGGFEVHLDGLPVQIPSRPAQALLAYLVLHPGVAHRREKLAGTLWPDAAEENARSSLRHALWRLRKALSEEHIQADRLAIAWRQDIPYRLDVDALLQAGDASTDELLTILSASVGELLPGFYGDWVRLERERLVAVYGERLSRLLDLLAAAGRWEEAIDWAERWIVQGETPELAYRTLMQAHAANGNRSAALQAYQRCVDALEKELGVPPSAETEALAARIRDADIAVYQPPATPHQEPTTVPEPTSGNLPAETTPFIGRVEEQERLAALLADPQHRLVTILGAGGMGKTRLTLAVADGQRERFPDGVFVMFLGSLRRSEEMVPTIAEALGLVFQGDTRSPRQQLLDFLRPRRLLLVLDNFEHLLDGAKLVVDLLQAAPHLHILVTSRERLHLQAETVFPLAGMAYPEEVHPPFFQDGQFSALHLFIEAARRLQPDFTPTAEDWPAMVHICKMVDGMPLGIVLAAAWMDVLTPVQIAAELEAGLDLLETDRLDVPDRQRSLRTVFHQTWQRLSEGEQVALMHLSVFRGSFDLPAVQAVAHASLPLLARLVGKALVQRQPGGRYDVHELVRQFALERLEAAGRSMDAFDRYSRFYLEFVAEWTVKLKSGRYTEGIRSIEQEQDNIRSAWCWALEYQRYTWIAQALEPLGIYFEGPGRWQEGALEMDKAAERVAADVEGSEARLLQAWLLAWQGALLHLARVSKEADAALETSLAMLANLDAPAGDVKRLRAFIHLHHGGRLMGSRTRQAMEQDRLHAVALYEELDEPWWLARALLALGNLEVFNGQVRRAEERYTRARHIAEQIGDRVVLAEILEQLSFLVEHAGRLAEAADLIHEREALRPAQDVGFNNSQRREVSVSASAGRFEESLATAQESLLQAQKRGVGVEHLQFRILNLARIHLHLGEFDEAQSLAESAAELWVDVYHWEHPFMLRTKGMALLALGEAEQAQQVLSQARADQEHMGNANRMPVAGALVDECYAFLALGEHEQARRTLVAGLALIQETGLYRFTIQVLPAVGLLLAATGATEDAAYVHALVEHFPHLTHSRWYAAVALDRLAKLVDGNVGVERAARRSFPQDLPAVNRELLDLLAGE